MRQGSRARNRDEKRKLKLRCLIESGTTLWNRHFERTLVNGKRKIVHSHIFSILGLPRTASRSSPQD
ncbi:hypothetical protein IGI04_030049 [Brassica rapa subsp. trilocularis]|uniref:Uncharacterized protein n=1 Tax=Brassica rapa subsp. trilocularis TaxID=1813537 RepID=A0ABQ7LPL3_BRACM|nr:hypothetical protein IGI04_030049 [Brassica rapa subsp. trilocularis]